jgi:Domain of unknown function (DUF4149)
MRSWTRFLQTALVGGWLGAALIVGFVVAPHAFAAFPTRVQAGDFVGGILRVVDGVAIAAGLFAAGGSVMRPGRFGRLRVGSGWALAIVGVASLGMDEKLAQIRASLGPIDALAADDPGRRHFGMLHGISMLILLVGMLSAGASLALDAAAGNKETV